VTAAGRLRRAVRANRENGHCDEGKELAHACHAGIQCIPNIMSEPPMRNWLGFHELRAKTFSLDDLTAADGGGCWRGSHARPP
jgi:hypothetical protein